MDPGGDLPFYWLASISTPSKEIALQALRGYTFLNDRRIDMYGKPMRVQTGQQGFVPSKFHPMGAILMPAPTIVSPGPSAPVMVRQDQPFLYPPAQVLVETTPAVGMSDDTKAILGVGAVIALLAIGAAIA